MGKVNLDRQKERTVYFDYLRVFATLSVMILHTSAQNWYTTNVNHIEWQTFNFFDSIMRWGVPIFVMISGSLFLNRDVPLKKIYSKYILRMAISFFVWSVIYALCMDADIVDKLVAIVQGHYHMWFILMIIGLYMCMSFIKPIVNSDERIRYFLLLAFLFAFVVPEFVTLANDFGNEIVVKGMTVFESDVDSMNMHIVLGYVSYFVLGYYFNKIDLEKWQRIIVYILGVFGFAFTIIVDLIVALKTQIPCSNYYGYFTVNVLFEAMAVFTWCKYHTFNHNKLNMFIQKLSKYSFGAYLVHALVIEQLNIRMGLNTLSFNPTISVIIISAITFILAFGISAILNHIPVIKKYLV